MQKNFFIYLFIAISAVNFGQNPKKKLDFYKNCVGILAHDSLNGRSAATVFETKAAQYITKELKKIKLSPEIHYFNCKRNDSSEVVVAKNIYCFINNKAQKTILLSAHYDHIGHGEGLSKSFGKKGIHNGADDNASGVALLISLTKELKKTKNKAFNYMIVFYSAHEWGLFGSTAFATFMSQKIDCVINFDMVGRLDSESKILTTFGATTFSETNQRNIENSAFHKKVYFESADRLNETDCKAFYNKGISCLSITTGIHNDYHKISDDANTLNYEGILAIEQYVVALLKVLE